MSDPTGSDPEVAVPEVIVCRKRSPGAALETFRERTGPRSRPARGSPGLVRLVTLASGYRSGEPLYDCIDGWFENRDAAGGARRSPELAAVTSHRGIDAGSVATTTTLDRVAEEGPQRERCAAALGRVPRHQPQEPPRAGVRSASHWRASPRWRPWRGTAG